MREQNKEVFNVTVQSTRPDGYRRGGYGLSRGVNRLEGVQRAALVAFGRDQSLLILRVVPLGLDSTEPDDSRTDVALTLPTPGAEATGPQLLDPSELSLVQRLAALIPDLTPEQYTQGGAPDIKALSAAVGEPVTAADRDAAFELHQQQMAGAE